MKSTITFLSLACIILIGSSSVRAQLVGAPPGASDKNLENRDIKSRSIELERIKRDAEKPDQNNQSQQMPKDKFEAIKQDFENIQRLQNEIVRAYTMSKQINYAKISSDAEEMNNSGTRLESNLFTVAEKKDKKKSKEQSAELDQLMPQDVKGLVVSLDNTLAAFVGNAMFTNPQVVNSSDNAKAHSDLKKLIQLSAALKLEAGKAVKQ